MSRISMMVLIALLGGCRTYVVEEPPPSEVELLPHVEQLDTKQSVGDVWRRAAAVLTLLNYPIAYSDEGLGLIETARVAIKELPCRWRSSQTKCEALQRATIVVQPGYFMVRINRVLRPQKSQVFFSEASVAFNIQEILDEQRELRDLVLEGPQLDKPLPSSPFDGMPVAGNASHTAPTAQ